jgi:hypothetical protein
MNSLPIYYRLTTILKSLPLSTKLRRVTGLFTLGVLAAGSCQLSDVARALSPFGTLDSQYRRLQRFLANARVERAAVQTAWAAWVLKQFVASQPRLLVDETKLGTHLSIMVLGFMGGRRLSPARLALLSRHRVSSRRTSQAHLPPGGERFSRQSHALL